MLPYDYSSFHKQPTPDLLKSRISKTRDDLKSFQEKIKEANQPDLSLHSRIRLLSDLKVKILQSHSTDALTEVQNSLAQLQSEACRALSEKYELCKGMSEEDIMLLYTSIPEDDMVDVMRYGQQLIPLEMNPSEKVRILLGLQKLFIGTKQDFRFLFHEPLAKIPSAEIADIIEEALKLFTDDMSVFFKVPIIEALAKVPREERTDVVGFALKLFTDVMNRARILTNISEVPQADRADVIRWALFTEMTCGFEKGSFLSDIAEIPQSERADVIGFALKLFTKKMDIFNFSMIMRFLSNIPPEERTDVVDWALKLFTEEMSGFSRVEILIRLFKIPQNDRADVVGWALFTEAMNGLERGSLLSHIAQIPQSERANLVEWALKLTTEQMSGIDKYDYLEKVLEKIPQELRDIASSAPHFFTETMSGFERALIVRTLIKIAQEGRKEVIDLVVYYLPETSNGFETVNLITAYLQVLQVKMTPHLFTKTMINTYKSYIVGALAQIPQNEREDIIGYILQLFTQKGTNPYDILEAIYFIKNIPLSERKSLFENSARLWNASMTWTEKITVLHVMNKTPFRQKDSLQDAEKYFTPEMPWKAKLELYLSCSNHLSLDEILKPAAVTEEDFEDLVEEDLDRILDDLFTPLPKDSIFADTDLILCKEDFPHTLPLNGIKLSELKEIEALALQIFSGSEKIKIYPREKQFEKQAQGYIKTLLTRPIGRKLIKKVMENQNINALTIKEGEKSCFNPSDSTIYLSTEETLVNPNQERYMQPPFIVLGHELIHASHADLSSNPKKPPTFDPDYDNLEEQITITGFKENIDWTESSEKKTMEWLKSQNAEEDWEEELIKTEDNFDPINERNLHAVFADSKHLFYPRASHKGYPKEHILKDPSAALLFVNARIANHLTQMKLKAPLNLQQVYAMLIP